MGTSNSDAPNKLFICPISHSVFDDPVVAKDGHTYERKAIERWIRDHGVSPITREPLSIDGLNSNRLVKYLIGEYQHLLCRPVYDFIMNVDIKRSQSIPLFRTTGKTIYLAEWLGEHKDRPKCVLVKFDGARAIQEASFYVQLTYHQNIVRTYGLIRKESNKDSTDGASLVQEYAPLGSLYDVLEERENISAAVYVKIFLQIVDGMIFLAENSVIHGDLACRNVLVFAFDKEDPEQLLVKVTDFGLSVHSRLYSRIPGALRTKFDIIPIRYAAPEVLLNSSMANVYTEKSDIYSMGVLMWEAYSLPSYPWYNIEKDNDVIERVINNEHLQKPANCSDSVWSIILRTWNVSPNDRPTFRELKILLEKEYKLLKSTIPVRWRELSPGLCVEGYCRNSSCAAYENGIVVICIGMSTFNLITDTDITTMGCPVCSEYVEPEECVLYKCEWRWSAIKQRLLNAPYRCEGDWTKADQTPFRFFDYQNDHHPEEIRWRRLVLEARSL